MADGTGTLDLLPVTEQDMDVTEGKQSCVNSVQGLPSTVSEDPDEIESMSARPETATPDVWALLVTTAKNTEGSRGGKWILLGEWVPAAR